MNQTVHAYSHRATNRKVFELIQAVGLPGSRIVDVGAGGGFFARMLGESLGRDAAAQRLAACDVHPENFSYDGIQCQQIDEGGRLPYPTATFDIACSIEVVEHVEDQFQFIRELHRITKPGGRVIVTTPNILNINSRLRTLACGFALLYDPLPLVEREVVHASSGHIHPISFYYLAYIFFQAGFTSVKLHIDRRKTSAALWLVLLYPVLKFAAWRYMARLRRRRPDMEENNRALVAQINSRDLLTGRTVIIEAIK